MGDALLTIDKPSTSEFLDVLVLDETFEEHGRVTLGGGRNEVAFDLVAGRYMLIGTHPSGSKHDMVIDLAPNENRRVTMVAADSSPHEWLADQTARGVLPRASRRAGDHPPSRALHDLFLPKGHGAFRLPIDDKGLAADRSIHPPSYALHDRFLPKGHGAFRLPIDDKGLAADRSISYQPEPELPRWQDDTFDVESMVWSSKRGRLQRSPLIASIEGLYAEDYTLLKIPPRHYLPPQDQERLHFLRIRSSNMGDLVTALPLFSEPLELVIAMPEISTEGPNDGLDWSLTTPNSMLDALLQSLAGASLAETAGLVEAALDFADDTLRGKFQDPVAATVAALVLLRYRKLERRAGWVKNLANGFPWLPDAQLLDAFAELAFGEGRRGIVANRFAALFDAGPPIFTHTRKLTRDLLNLTLEEKKHLHASKPAKLRRLATRMAKETPHEIESGPVYAFRSAPKGTALDASRTR